MTSQFNTIKSNDTMFDLTILPHDEERTEPIRFNWTIIEFNSDNCLIKLTFENPVLISSEIGEDDLLRLEVINPE